jgi:uncharacterized protein involved in exopolysaccharide biosynthesis
MTYTHGQNSRPDLSAGQRSGGQVDAGWGDRARLSSADLITLLWQERMLMLAAFAVLLVLGVGLALFQQTRYTANASLLVRLGQEYVYEPRAGDAARGAIPDTGEVIQSEIEILTSAPLKVRVIERLGLMRLYPKMAKAATGASPQRRAQIMASAVAAMDKALSASSAPDTSIVRLTFQHPSAETAALVLNTLLEDYLTYRQGVLGDPTGPALEQQRRSFQQRLTVADAAFGGFLNSNRIGDFEVEKSSLSQLQAGLEQQKYSVEAQLQEKRGRLAAIARQFSSLPAEIGLSRDVDTSAATKLLNLRIQREDLLTRYRPDARPVQELDVQIGQLQQMITGGGAVGDSARRYGVNPVYQTLQTEKIQLTAEVEALRSAYGALTAQMAEVMQRRLKLAELEPEYQGLARDREVLQANVRAFSVKEQQTQAAQAIAAQSNDNIRIIQRAMPPARGKSLKRPVLMLAVLFAAFTALCLGLGRVFLRPGFSTAASAARTLDLPVLAVARVKP